MAFSIETNLGELLDNPQSRAVLDEHVPMSGHTPADCFCKGHDTARRHSFQQRGSERRKSAGRAGSICSLVIAKLFLKHTP